MERWRLGAVLSIVVLALAEPATAQERYNNHDDFATRGDRYDPGAHDGPQVVTVGSKLKAAIAAARNNDWSTAQARLEDAHQVSNPSDLDRFEIEVVSGFIAINTGDHAMALASYRKVIASPYFRSAQARHEQEATLKNAMILSNEVGAFSDAISYGETLDDGWRLDDVSALALASAYFGNRDYRKAETMAQKAIDLASDAGRPVSEDARQILAKSRANLK
jgi:tetratricopeptide (TPR) repeat protein